MASSAGGADPRWEALFADLEAQQVAQERSEVEAEIAERTRRERALVPLMDRLTAGLEQPVTLQLVTQDVIRGALADLGSDWLLLSVPAGALSGDGRAGPGRPGQALVRVAAVVGVVGPPRRAMTARSARRFGFGAALRVLSRDRVTVTVHDVGGGAVTGTIDAVGADCFDLSEHHSGELRRSANVTGARLVPFAAVTVVRAAMGWAH